MAAKSITIKNTKESINSGTFIGHFNEDRTIYEFDTIRYKIGKDKISSCKLIIKLLNGDNELVPITDELLDGGQLAPNMKAAIEKITGQEGGTIRKSTPTYITTGKNIGKSNETNIITQAFRQALGTYNTTISKVASNIVGKDGEESVSIMPPPMLVQKIQNFPLKEQDFIDGITLQKKLNGVHYITFIDENQSIVKYSRGGLIYPNTSMPKITKDMNIIFNNSMVFCTGAKTILDEMKQLLNLTDDELELYKGAIPYYAGELYKHGISLNIISGQAKNKKTSIDLEYHVFDVFFPTVIKKGHNLTSIYRQKFIDYIFHKTIEFELKYIKRVENYKVHNMLEINALYDDFISNGYEGAIARKDNGIYRYSFNNYHSREVLKIKPTFDSEFKIVGFTQGLKGEHLGALIWICTTENDLTFHVVPNMEIDERKELYKKFSEKKGESVIGKLLTVSYAELSPKGIPLQPKGIAIRDYE
jgi:hypothetical protein